MKFLLPFVFLAAVSLLRAQAPQDRERRGDDRYQSYEELQLTVSGLEAAVTQDPARAELRIRLGFAYLKLTKIDAAQEAFETAVRLDPKRAIAHYMLGLIYEKKGLTDNAVSAWKACLENARETELQEKARKHLHHLTVNR